MKLSVIVTTSPGREEHLMYCLTMLTRQVYRSFEVLVMDDGSKESGQVCRLFAGKLNLSYYYRPNDRCVSRSRNLGALTARGSHLIFLDVDMLLNPLALQAYVQALKQHPKAVVYGYMGYHQDYLAPSQWFPERSVNYLDIRFHKYYQNKFEALHSLMLYPYLYGLGANLGVSKEVFNAVGGFNDAYDSWGQEDLEFSYDLIQAGFEIHFSLDTWGEHQYHGRSGGYHNQKQRKQVFKMDLIKVDYPVQVLATKPVVGDLLNTIFRHYSQQSDCFTSEQKLALQREGACLYFLDQHSPGVLSQHTRLPDTKKIDFIMTGSIFEGLELIFGELALHPQISQPHNDVAVHYFDLDENFVRLERWYHDQFPARTGALRGEVTPGYFYASDVALRMAHYNPELKVIIILQNPVDRAWLEYLSLCPEATPERFAQALMKQENKEALSIFKRGLYDLFLPEFLQHFSKEQLCIVNYHDLQENRADSLQFIHAFLNFEPDFVAPLLFADLPKPPVLPVGVRNAVASLYQDSHQQLKKQLINMPYKQGMENGWCAL